MNYHLPRRQIQKLKNKYRKIAGQRHADRIRVVLALASGYSASEVASLFLLDADTVRRYFCLYKEGGIMVFGKFTIMVARLI
jgi:transposase